MEAKDRIIKTNEENCHDTLEERLTEQDKVSFKAGMEEMVGFILLHRETGFNKHGNIYIKPSEWEVKLKEWELCQTKN